LDEFATTESFSVGASCTVSTDDGMFTNRIHTGGSVCFLWNSCSTNCQGSDTGGGDTGGGDTGGGDTSDDAEAATFCVDMNNFSGSFTTAFISGTFNAWCGGCNPLSDEDGDGIWCGSASLEVGSDYKFQVDEFATQEIFMDGDPCTQTFGDNGEFVNRIYDGAAEVCFE